MEEVPRSRMRRTCPTSVCVFWWGDYVVWVVFGCVGKGALLCVGGIFACGGSVFFCVWMCCKVYSVYLKSAQCEDHDNTHTCASRSQCTLSPPHPLHTTPNTPPHYHITSHTYLSCGAGESDDPGLTSAQTHPLTLVYMPVASEESTVMCGRC